MIIKRKRNAKLENDVAYQVLNEYEIEMSYLEEYKPPTITTGMEIEEEKEHHLKSIIVQGTGKIPIPVVKKSKKLDLKEWKRPASNIHWTEDCENKILIDQDDKKFIKYHNLTEKDFFELLEVKDFKSYQEKNDIILMDSVIDYIEKRKVKVLDTESMEDFYICFRKRIIKPPKKSRRTEENVLNRLRRMWIEFNSLNNLYNHHLKRCELEKDLLKTNNEIIDYADTPKIMKLITKKLFKRKDKVKEYLFYKTCDNLEELSSNPAKLKKLKELMNTPSVKLSGLDLEKEAKALEEAFYKGF